MCFFLFYPVKKSQTNRDLVRHVLLKSLNTIGQDPGDVVERPMTIFRPITLFYSSLIHSLVSLHSQVWISIETKKKNASIQRSLRGICSFTRMSLASYKVKSLHLPDSNNTIVVTHCNATKPQLMCCFCLNTNTAHIL